jgi:predicted dinucleotide-binding enzyme
MLVRLRREIRMRASHRVSRRRFMTLAVLTAAALGVHRSPVLAQAKATANPMKIGIVGSGNVGGTVGALWVKAGHELMFSSRHPEQLKAMAAKLGARAHVGTVPEAIAFGNVVFLAVPYSALPQIGRDNAAALAGKIVIDASNPIARRDGQVAEEAMASGIGPTSLKYLPGVRYVRTFNSVGAEQLERDSHRAGTPIGVPMAGDDAQAIKVATQLVRDAGFEPVAVPLARAMDFAPGTALFGRGLPADELEGRLGRAK